MSRAAPTVGALYGAAAVTGTVLLLIGLALGRPDVALIAVPGLLAAVFGRTTRPASSLVVTELPQDRGLRGIVSTVRIAGVQLAQVRASASGHRITEVAVRVPPGGRELDVRLASVRTGPQETALVDVRGYDGLWCHAPVTVGATSRLVLPTSIPLGDVPVPRTLRGLTGPRVSRRLGDGNELRDIHPFAPGDRLRRIDWRATARHSPTLETLYVRRTFADAEAAVMLVVDSRDDVGPDLRTWRGFSERRVDEATSLDLARHAAASIAQALIAHGDRVGVVDLGRDARPLPPATGRRQLRRVMHGLALAHPVGEPNLRVRPPQVPADALVYLFSTVLDDAAAHLVRTWRSVGHPVVVIDTLPDVRPADEPRLAIGWQIVRLERQARLDGLAREGVPILSWAGSARSAAPAILSGLARGAARRRDWR